jgi:hypothetical protein
MDAEVEEAAPEQRAILASFETRRRDEIATRLAKALMTHKYRRSQ